MKSRALLRRLERLEAELGLKDEQVLIVTLTRIGQPDKVIEVRLPKPDGRRRSWKDHR